MSNQHIKQQLNQIVNTIGSLRDTVKGNSYEDFRSNEQTKEMVYSYLQELGQAAFELDPQLSDAQRDQFATAQLAAFRNARYNQEMEMNHQPVWHLINEDLVDIADEIEHSEAFSS